MLLEHEKVVRYLDRLCGLTTDVRNLYRPFVSALFPNGATGGAASAAASAEVDPR
jgi:hypothetical protein